MVPVRLGRGPGADTHMIRVVDPPSTFPDFSRRIAEKIARNRDVLRQAGVPTHEVAADLLASEDSLLGIARELETHARPEGVWVLDVSSMPKRFFCFLMKRIAAHPRIRNAVLTYTSVPATAYTMERLATNPLQCDHLPGFASGLDRVSGVAVSVGFEPLRFESLLDKFAHEVDPDSIRYIVPFPPTGTLRVYRTLMHVTRAKASGASGRIEVVSAFDAEHVHRLVSSWHDELGTLALAPFGPKPHSIGLALAAIEHRLGLYYSQPRVYHPDYCTGPGQTIAYVVKWEGMNCYERQLDP